ncbi:MAG: hypothetical protein K6F68_01840 [Clostridiales bacterium]|nr:hypothetical protein [Clostridiales bacterium]
MERNSKRKKRSPIAVILRAIACVIAALLLVYAALMLVIPAFETVDRTLAEGSADWMKGLDDGMPISEVVLPGTHDSAASNVRLAFFSKCQALSVVDQLEAGFRYLDIRLASDGERLKLVHGFVECKENAAPWSKPLYLDSVLEGCYAFLEAHPTEFVVFAAKKDHGDDPDTHVSGLLDALIEKAPGRWLLTDSIPTVGEARGKLVLMRRWTNDEGADTFSGIRFSWTDQPNREMTAENTVMTDNGSYTLWVQDRYKYGTEDKWTAFISGFKDGKSDGGNILLNFLSTNGTAKFGHPYTHAKALNARFLEIDRELKGWIIVDFASSAIAQKIYSANFCE